MDSQRFLVNKFKLDSYFQPETSILPNNSSIYGDILSMKYRNLPIINCGLFSDGKIRPNVKIT